MVQEQIAESADESLKFFIDNIHEAGLEARDLVKNLASFSRGSNGELQTPLLSPVLEDIERMLKPVLTSSINLRLETTAQIPQVMVDPEHVHQMITNLCINARDALGGSGEVVISLRQQKHLTGVCSSCHEKFEGDFVELAVTDNGPGIPEAVIESMFDPFVSNKEVGQGTGLGLSMVHGSMHGSNGHILVTSRANEGTIIKLLFPVPKELN